MSYKDVITKQTKMEFWLENGRLPTVFELEDAIHERELMI